MSHPHWESIHSNPTLPGSEPGHGIAPESASRSLSADMAIDAALRSVPLPEGLLTRLDRFIRTMPDEAADQVDWLSC
jgi:hypothetical protein